MDYEQYIDHRKRLYDLAVDQINKFDRLIMTLSGGALTLSITFFKDIAPEPQQGSTQWLAVGWIALVASVLVILFSHQSSQKDMFCEIYRLDQLYQAGQEHDGRSNIWNKLTRVLNFSSSILFCAGVSSLARYVYLNLI